MNLVTIISALNDVNLQDDTSLKTRVSKDYVLIGHDHFLHEAKSEARDEDKCSDSANYRLNRIEKFRRRKVDMQLLISLQNQQSLQLHLLNTRDPVFKLKFTDLPDFLVNTFMISGINLSDLKTCAVSANFDDKKLFVIDKFYAAFIQSFVFNWKSLEITQKERTISEFKNYLWQQCNQARLFSKNGYARLFTNEELETSLFNGVSLTTSNIVILQDIFKINILLIDETTVRYEPTLNSRMYHPFLIILQNQHEFYSLHNEIGEPFLMRDSKDSRSIKDLIAMSENRMPSKHQSIDFDFAKMKLEKLKLLCEHLGIDRVKADNKQKNKTTLISEILEHQFTDDEIITLKNQYHRASN